MRATSKFRVMAGALLLGSLAGLPLVTLQASAVVEPQAPAAAPRFVYANGAQGTGFYPQQTAPRTAARPQASNRSVGPGVRNWSTGRRSPLHRPWMRP